LSQAAIDIVALFHDLDKFAIAPTHPIDPNDGFPSPSALATMAGALHMSAQKRPADVSN
jgi:hypothetical protein